MELQQSLNNQTDVSLTITGRVLSSTEAKNTNLVVSPLSLDVVLSLITAGSSGATLDQLLSFLKAHSSYDLNKLCYDLVPLIFADGSSDGGPKMSYANGVWMDQTIPLSPIFKDIVHYLYKADHNQVDFVNNVCMSFFLFNLKF
uniref:Serpin domain-containing protein n=1 Tax=Chenopodium quinoa TaxID=63459 RepID=A0A803MGK7_CHEQI